MTNIIEKILNFFIILKIFNWFSIVAVFKTLIGRAKQIQSQWAKINFNYFKVKAHQFEGSHQIKPGKVIIYANHRSQSDFFLHNVLANFQTNFLSRMAVLFVCPIFLFSYKTVWFFNRNNKIQPEKFNQWLDKKFRDSTRPGLLVYPEGHRMQGSTKVDQSKIKTGMIRYAYRRKIPSQILITFGNEQIFDEKRLHIGLKYNYTEIQQNSLLQIFRGNRSLKIFLRTRICSKNQREILFNI